MIRLKNFWQWFWQGIENSQHSRDLRVIAKNLRGFFKKCPACQANFNEHQFARLAVAVMSKSTSNKITEFLDEAKNHNWQKTLTFQEFDKFEDALVFQIIKCPSGKSVRVMTFEPYSLDDSYQIAEFEVLNEIESQKLMTLIEDDKWDEL